MISVQCPSCKMVHSLPESALGKNARCNDCQHVFVVTHDAGLVELGVGQGVVSPAPQKIQLHPPSSLTITPNGRFGSIVGRTISVQSQ